MQLQQSLKETDELNLSCNLLCTGNLYKLFYFLLLLVFLWYPCHWLGSKYTDKLPFFLWILTFSISICPMEWHCCYILASCGSASHAIHSVIQINFIVLPLGSTTNMSALVTPIKYIHHCSDMAKFPANSQDMLWNDVMNGVEGIFTELKR